MGLFTKKPEKPKYNEVSNLYNCYQELPIKKMLETVCKQESDVEQELFATRLEGFGSNKWYTSKDPVLLTLYQLDMGYNELVFPEVRFAFYLSYILDKKVVFYKLEKEWDTLYAEIKTKLSRELGKEKVDAIIASRPKTKREHEKELEDIFKIDF